MNPERFDSSRVSALQPIHLNAVQMNYITGFRILLGAYRIGLPPGDIAARLQLQNSLMKFVIVPFAD